MIQVQRGQSVRWRLTLKQDNQPIDITGATWEVLESKIPSSVEISDATNGVSHLIIDKDATLGQRPRDYTIRARLIKQDGSAIATPIIKFKLL